MPTRQNCHAPLRHRLGNCDWIAPLIDDMLLLNALAARSLLFQGMGSMTSQPATMALSTVEASHSVEAVRAANAIGLLDGPFFLVLSGLAFARAELTT